MHVKVPAVTVRELLRTPRDGTISPADANARRAKASARSADASGRPAHRCLQVARTIADLSGAEEIAPEHVAEAVQYQILERRG